MDVHGFPVRVIETGIDWGVVAAWAQFAGSMIALIVAIGVPWWQERSRLKQAQRDLADRRIAAYRAMEAVIQTIAAKTAGARMSEIDGAAQVLDGLDLGIFTPEAIVALVGLRGRIAMAAAEVNSNVDGDINALKPFTFKAAAARKNLKICAVSMGVKL